MDNRDVIDTISAAKLYLSNLRTLDTEIETAVKQILTTYEETEKNIRDTFSNLKQTLTDILNKREHCLVDRAIKIKKEGLAPLEECRNVILEKMGTTNKLIDLGESILNGGLDNPAIFDRDANMLGTLPEVPELKEVPFISFNYDPSLIVNIKDVLIHFGGVNNIAPVQIRELVEKPGAMLVEWHCVNDDCIIDIQEFKLQRAFGDVTKEKHLFVNFLDCYTGLDTQYLVKDLQPNQPYSFRVACKFEGALDWSPWSVPQVAETTVQPFSWRNDQNYALSNEGRIAKPTKTSPGILRSNGPQFCIGHSVDFTLLETDTSDALLGLVCSSEMNGLTRLCDARENSFLINRRGEIFVDGVAKSTMLSEFSQGLKVSFACDLINGNKVRVNIDSNDKRVTYDWPIRTDSKMFFVCQFASSKWKIMVE